MCRGVILVWVGSRVETGLGLWQHVEWASPTSKLSCVMAAKKILILVGGEARAGAGWRHWDEPAAGLDNACVDGNLVTGRPGQSIPRGCGRFCNYLERQNRDNQSNRQIAFQNCHSEV